MIRILFLVVLITFSIPLLLSAQEPDIELPKSQLTEQKRSPDSSDTHFCRQNIFGFYEFRKIEYPIHTFNAYDPIYPNNNYYASLGNPGQASKPIIFTFTPNPGELLLRQDAYAPYRLSSDSIRFIDDIHPYSEINYVMGKAKEQKLNFTIAEQVRKRVFLGLDVRYLNAPGLYQRQRAYYAGMDFNLRYNTQNNRYGILAAYIWDRLAVNENGGVFSDDDFTLNYESNRRTIAVNLDAAINRNKYSEIFLQHYFNTTSKRKFTEDSAGRKPFFDAGRFVHTLKYSRNGSGYMDSKTNPNFYPAIYNDSSFTYDSIFHTRLYNCIVFSNLEPDTGIRVFPVQYAFGLKNAVDNIYTIDTDTVKTNFTYSSIQPFGVLKGIIRNKTFFSAKGTLSLYGYTAGDHEISGVFSQYFGRKKNNTKVFIEIVTGMREPDFIFAHCSSNHFRWDNSLNKEIYQFANGGITLRNFSLTSHYSLISNYTYSNNQILPEQYSGIIKVYKLSAQKDLWLRNWLIKFNIVYQYISPGQKIAVPDLIGRLSVVYNAELFKRVLKANIGVNIFYFTKYYSDAYMPAIRSFYRQNDFLLGGYPYADAFINLKIKRARLFLMYQHFNAGLMGYDYMMVPHYPQPDASLKFGVNWVFHD